MCLRTGIVEGSGSITHNLHEHQPFNLQTVLYFYAGAIIDAFDENGRTAFHLACKRGQTSTCALLLALCHPTAANDLPLPEHSTMVVPLGPGEAELFTPRTLLKSGVSVLILLYIIFAYRNVSCKSIFSSFVAQRHPFPAQNSSLCPYRILMVLMSLVCVL